jgi:serine/alanine adding enzyme
MDSPITIALLRGPALKERLDDLTTYAMRGERRALTWHPHWLYVLRDGLGHVPCAFVATRNNTIVGYLPLLFVRSTLFGRYLVSLPYLNSGGLIGDTPAIKAELLEAAVAQARKLRVKYLELRHEEALVHPLISGAQANKVHMRLELPDFPGKLWEAIPAKVRNQVRKGEKSNLSVHWGTHELLDELYSIFAQNMRDLGTPVYSRKLFSAMLKHFPDSIEICVVRQEGLAIAAGVLCHGNGVTEVPSASSLREHNATCANMLMYWNMLDRAILRGSQLFDFGRSTVDGPTFKFKKQWGATPSPAVWQYHTLSGKMRELKPDNPKYARFIRMWQKLPVPLTKVIGPRIVRGIP